MVLGLLAVQISPFPSLVYGSMTRFLLKFSTIMLMVKPRLH
jgi:hypothetical protein